MRADLLVQFNAKKAEVRQAVSMVGKPMPFGHAFIWGNVPVTLKNGKVKFYKACITSVCTDDLNGCLAVAESLGVKHPYYNMD